MGVVAVLFVGAVVVVAWSVWRKPADPEFRGIRLSEWLKAYSGAYGVPRPPGSWEGSDEAVRRMGTNAIPLLLDMIQAKDSLLTLKLVHLASKQRLIRFNYENAAVRSYESYMAFKALGPSASNAVPELIRIYGRKYSAESRRGILSSLGGIGPAAKDAIPFLLQVAANTNEPAWMNSVGALGAIHSEPEMVVPVLQRFLQSADPNVRAIAAQGLGHFGREAKTATSDLLQLLEDRVWRVRHDTLTALVEIYHKRDWEMPVSIMGNYEPWMVARVIDGLGAMGTNASAAVPGLVKFLGDSDEGIRTSAAAALKAIDRARLTEKAEFRRSRDERT
jgi:HEAT repeat protein